MIFEFGLKTSADDFFAPASKWTNLSQYVRHSARDQNMQISTVDVTRRENLQASMAVERDKRRSGKFFVTGVSCLVCCKTPPTRKALSCLYFRKTKTKEHIVGDECARVMFP